MTARVAPAVDWKVGRCRHETDGFTLVELLAAMSVLGLILVLMVQLFNGALSAGSVSHRQMDNGTEARLVLERIGADLARMVRRGDVDYKFDKKPGSDAFAFYAEVPGYFDATSGATPRTLSVLDYRINTGFKLERGARGLGVNQMVFSNPPLPFAPNSSTYRVGPDPSNPAPFNNLPLIGAADYTRLGDQIFRLEYCYLLKSGKLSATPNPPNDLNGQGGPNYRPDPDSFRQVAAVVVAFAMLDAHSRALLGDPAGSICLDTLARLAAALPDVDPDPSDASNPEQSPSPTAPNPRRNDILTVWNPKVLAIAAGTDPGTATVPRPVATGVRVYQRYYYLK